MKRPPARRKARAPGQYRRDRDTNAVTLGPLAALAHQLAIAMKKARGLGIFVDDRELLICPRCGLMEDVLADGRLITCHGAGEADTGLRFAEDQRRDGQFICPECQTVFQAS